MNYNLRNTALCTLIQILTLQLKIVLELINQVHISYFYFS